MWRPGFCVRQSAAARVFGYSRRLAVKSFHYRGTPQKPGLVFGLDAGGSCNGAVLRVAAKNKKRVLQILFRREMFAGIYNPVFIKARLLATGKQTRALAFAARRDTPHYAPPLSLRETAGIIRSAKGAGGGNEEYIQNTRKELERLGIPCPQLAKLCAALNRQTKQKNTRKA